jgi:hypothetical protein
MASVYEARLRNAQRLGARIERLLSEGHLIFDEDGGEIREVLFRGFNDLPGLSFRPEKGGNVTLIYFTHDPHLDEGSHTPIKEFNAKFKGWRSLHPDDLKPLL